MDNDLEVAGFRGDRFIYVDNIRREWFVARSAAEIARSRASTPLPMAELRPPTRPAERASPLLIVYKLTHKCNIACEYCYDRDHTRKLRAPERSRAIRKEIDAAL